MSNCDFVNMFRITGFQSIQYRHMFIISIFHSSLMRERKFGECLHTVHKGGKYGRKLFILKVSNNLGVKLKIIFAKFINRMGGIHNYFHIVHDNMKFFEQSLCFSALKILTDLKRAVALQRRAYLKSFVYILLGKLMQHKSLIWNNINISFLGQSMNCIPKWSS